MLLKCQTDRSGGGGEEGGGLANQLVPMLEQKRSERVLFSSCSVRSSVIVYGQKNGILLGKG